MSVTIIETGPTLASLEYDAAFAELREACAIAAEVQNESAALLVKASEATFRVSRALQRMGRAAQLLVESVEVSPQAETRH